MRQCKVFLLILLASRIGVFSTCVIALPEYSYESFSSGHSVDVATSSRWICICAWLKSAICCTGKKVRYVKHDSAERH